MIAKMTLSNQSHFPRLFSTPESHLVGFCRSFKMTLAIGKKGPLCFLIMFAQGGSPTPHPFSSRPHFVCKFSRQRSTEVFKTLAPQLTVLDFPYFADAYSCTVRPIDFHNF
jgi:hypothetical protein